VLLYGSSGPQKDGKKTMEDVHTNLAIRITYVELNSSDSKSPCGGEEHSMEQVRSRRPFTLLPALRKYSILLAGQHREHNKG